ncbi:phosphoadenosine phosphosulfate reductase family protein [Robertkochia solimangrovi]|uniref:phosphoadenosine phosphosulfate reductase domain-containing protein n=1 Tax=Robertkochia solimangrovi TaxID=2213046 RepID=UPI00117C1516|nr:phosphoadenosine phosphosulfate reductase family protein [Robertkochia solimangrovi]TRZ44200.1 phosphoadenylylsulfate reductase [Robertkochia solimangrovi]
MDIRSINSKLRTASPEEVVAWALAQAKNPVVTTNFRPYEAAILHLVSEQLSDIPVIWCDTGYNTPNTYNHARKTIDQLKLNVKLFVPQQTAAYRDSLFQGIPGIDDPNHKLFTEQVKLEPFRRAMSTYKPDLWFTNLRKGQTAFRDTLDIVSSDASGVIKVSPFFYATDEELDNYLLSNELENEFKYFDPTKVLENRECGLHLG